MLPLLIAAGSALYSGIQGNQNRQKQKGVIGKQQAADDALVARDNERYANLSPFRTYAQNEAAGAAAPQDFSQDYVDPTNPYAGGSYSGPITSKYSPLVAKTVGTVANAPDRMALIQGALDDYDANESAVLRDQYQGNAQQNARTGRLGSGMAEDGNNRILADATVRRKTLSNDLIREGVSGTLADRLAQLSAIRGVSNDDVNLQGAERDYLSGKGRDAVGYKTGQRTAEQNAKTAATNRATQLANVGFESARPTGAGDRAMAGFYGDAADSNEAGVNELLQYLPYLLKGKAKTGGMTGTSGYTE